MFSYGELKGVPLMVRCCFSPHKIGHFYIELMSDCFEIDHTELKGLSFVQTLYDNEVLVNYRLSKHKP